MEIKFSDIRFFILIAGLSELLPLILFFFRKQKRNNELKLVFTYQLISFIADFLFYIIKSKLNPEQASITLDIFTILALIILTYLFRTVLTVKMFRKAVLYSAAGLIVYIITKIFISQSFVTFNSLNVAILAIIIIVWSIIFYYEQLTKPADGNQLFLYSSTSFWIVTAYLIYFAGNFFLFIYSQHKDIEKDLEFATQYSLINGVFVLIKNILLSVAMFVKAADNSKLTGKYRTHTY